MSVATFNVPVSIVASSASLRVSNLGSQAIDGGDEASRRPSTELRLDKRGEVSVEELFYMRVATLRLSRRWVGCVDPRLTGAMGLVVAAMGFVAGFMATRAVDLMAGLEGQCPLCLLAKML